MASVHKHIRSGTVNKRPTTAIAEGQIALATNIASPGLFFKDSTGATIVKIGPVHVGATAPNVSPAGSAGNSIGEIWLDTSLTPIGVKIYNGSAFVNATPIGSTTVQGLLELATDAETQAGADTARAVTSASLQSKLSDSTSTTSNTTIASSTAVKAAYDLANAALPKTGGTVTGNLEIGTAGSLTFEGATADGFETTIAVVDPTADRTITLPNITGTIVTTGDTGTVTSTMILDGTIVDADINASAEISVSKLVDGSARQLLQTDAAGTGVEWASNIDIPGTLDVTSAATFDSTVTIAGDLTVNGTTTNINTVNLTVEDKNVIIGDVATPTDITADGGGITLKGTTDKTINWVDATDAWTLSEHVNIASAKEYRIAGTKVLDATSLGSAVVSSSLTSVGTIGTGVWQGTAITDTYLATIATAGKVSNSATTAASANTASAIVARDGSGNFTAGTITAALTGAASSNVLKAGDTMTGALVVPLASAATPSLTFTGDLDTGVFSPGANQVAVATNGTQKLIVLSNGNVGVGASAPGVPLHVAATGAGVQEVQWLRNGQSVAADVGSALVFTGTTSDNGLARITGAFTGSTVTDGAYMAFSTRAVTTGTLTERLRITAEGLVGIGTGSPAINLQVNAASDVSIALSNSSSVTSGNRGNISCFNSAVSSVGLIRFAAVTDNVGTEIQFHTRPAAGSLTQTMTLDSSGRLGIGTTSPSQLLHLNGASSPCLFVTDTTNNVQSYVFSDDNAGNFGTGSAHPLVFKTGDTEKARIRSDGMFEVKGAGTAGSSPAFSVNGSAPANSAIIDTSGRLLVGTSSVVNDYWLGGAQSIQSAKNSLNGILVYTATAFTPGHGSFLGLHRANGTMASPAIVANGDTLGAVYFGGYDGSSYLRSAAIDCVVDVAPGADDMPSRLVFSTTADGASSPTERWRYSSNGETRISNMAEIFPVTDNACLLGRSSFRWSAVWAANGTIQTSDERTKTEITDAALGTDFIKSLRPVSYRWVEGGKRPTGELDEDNNYIYESVPGERTHWGFIAQEVKQAVNASGVDFGGWVLTDKDDPDSQQALRYDQFIAPLTKALQETMAELEVLKAEVAALKAQ